MRVRSLLLLFPFWCADTTLKINDQFQSISCIFGTLFCCLTPPLVCVRVCVRVVYAHATVHRRKSEANWVGTGILLLCGTWGWSFSGKCWAIWVSLALDISFPKPYLILVFLKSLSLNSVNLSRTLVPRHLQTWSCLQYRTELFVWKFFPELWVNLRVDFKKKLKLITLKSNTDCLLAHTTNQLKTWRKRNFPSKSQLGFCFFLSKNFLEGTAWLREMPAFFPRHIAPTLHFMSLHWESNLAVVCTPAPPPPSALGQAH